MNDHVRRHMALFLMGIVMELTDLTARQIRYYEANNLIHPARSQANRRLFSFHDVDRLLKIKFYIDKGLNIAGIKQVIDMEQTKHEASPAESTTSDPPRPEMTDAELKLLLKQQITHARQGETPISRGELHRFYRY